MSVADLQQLLEGKVAGGASTAPSRQSTFGSVRWGLAAPFVGLLLALPFVITNRFYLHIVILALIFAALNLTWNLVLGVAGILSFAHLAFFAIGGYTASVLALHAGWTPALSTIAGGVTAGIAGLVVGALSLRTRGVYILLLTWAFAEIVRTVILADNSGFTGGSLGLTGVAGYFPESLSRASELRLSYYAAVALFLGVALLIFRLMHSPIGLAFQALRDNEVYAAARGISRFRYNLLIFVITAVLAGVVGAFYAHYLGTMTPTVLGFGLIANLLAMIVIGGWGTFAGPIVGTIVLVALTEMLQGLEQFRLIIIGSLVALTLLFLPSGLMGLLDRVMPPIRRAFANLLTD